MRIRKIIVLAVLAVALAIPGVSLAKKGHGIGKGGLPALRDYLLNEIHDLQNRLDDINGGQLDALGPQFKDEDKDGFYVFVPDCDDQNPDLTDNCTPPAAH